MKLEGPVKLTMVEAVKAAKEELEWAGNNVKDLEERLARAKSIEEAAQKKYNTLSRFVNDNS